MTVAGSYKTGSTAVVDLLREYHDVCVIDGEFKPLEGGLGEQLKRVADGKAISHDEIRRFERGMTRYGTGSVRWGRAVAKVIRRLQSGRFRRVFPTGVLSRYGKTAGFDTRRVFPGFGTAADQLSSDLRSIAAVPDPIADRRGELIRALRRFFVSILSPYSGLVPVLDQFIKPGNLALADLFPFARIIVVSRDPRDQFCDIVARKAPKAKYQRSDRAQQFIAEYSDRYHREDELVRDAPANVLPIQFEDLVYRYRETKTAIEDFLDLNPDKKTSPTFFDAGRARANTQLFLRHERPEEVQLIEEHVKFRLYDFENCNS